MIPLTVADIAPILTLDDPGTTNTTPTLTGTAGITPGDASTVTLNLYSGSSATGTPLQTHTVDADTDTGIFSYTLDPPAGTYTFDVTQTEDAGNTATSDPETFNIDLQLPAAPNNFTATAVSATEIDTAWDTPNPEDYLTGQSLYVSTDYGQNFTHVADLSASATSEAITGLSPLTPYEFELFATNASGDSPNQISPATWTQSGIVAPDNLDYTLVDGGLNGINLTWDNHSTTQTAYQIEVEWPGTNFTLLDTLAASATSYSYDEMPTENMIFRVRAVRNGVSAYSNEKTVTADTSFMGTSTTYGLTATDEGTSVLFNWTQSPTTAGTSFLIRNIGTSAGPRAWAQFGDHDGTYTDGLGSAEIPWSSLTAPGDIQIAMRTDDSYISNLVTLTPPSSGPNDPTPATPTGLTAAVLDSESIGITFDNNSFNETGVTIERSLSSTYFDTAHGLKTFDLDPDQTLFIDSAATDDTFGANVQYYFRAIRKSTTAGNSAPTSAVSVTTAPLVVNDIEVTMNDVTKKATDTNRTINDGNVFAVPENSGTFTLTAEIPNKSMAPDSDWNKLGWYVERNPNDVATGSLPTLGSGPDPSAYDVATLTTNAVGSFNIIAYVDKNNNGSYDAGEELRVMHLAIVEVTVVNTTGTGSVLNTVVLRNAVGTFNPTHDPNLAMVLAYDKNAANVTSMILKAQITYIGGGADKTIGLSKIHSGWLGNVTAATASVTYPGGHHYSYDLSHTATLPLLDIPGDAQPTGGAEAFRNQSNEARTGLNATVSAADAPALIFDNTHSFGGAAAVKSDTIAFHTSFIDYLTAFSDDFKKTYTDYTTVAWTLDVNMITGTVAPDIGLRIDDPAHPSGIAAPTITNVPAGGTPPATTAPVQPDGKINSAKWRRAVLGTSAYT